MQQLNLTFLDENAFFQICIILGVLLMVLAPIGALREIIIQAKNFKFYS